MFRRRMMPAGGVRFFIVGCGESYRQNKSQSNVTGNTSSIVNDNQAQTYNGWTTIKVEGEVEFQVKH